MADEKPKGLQVGLDNKFIINERCWNLIQEDPELSMEKSKNELRLRFVLVQDYFPENPGLNKYSAYVGIGQTEFVAKSGVKLIFREAKLIFPYIQEEKYRS